MVIKRGRGGRGPINEVMNLCGGAFYLEGRGMKFQTKKNAVPHLPPPPLPPFKP